MIFGTILLQKPILELTVLFIQISHMQHGPCSLNNSLKDGPLVLMLILFKLDPLSPPEPSTLSLIILDCSFTQVKQFSSAHLMRKTIEVYTMPCLVSQVAKHGKLIRRKASISRILMKVLKRFSLLMAF